jgi:hypothetical protein
MRRLEAARFGHQDRVLSHHFPNAARITRKAATATAI